MSLVLLSSHTFRLITFQGTGFLFSKFAIATPSYKRGVCTYKEMQITKCCEVHANRRGKTDAKLRTNLLIYKTPSLMLQKLFTCHLPHFTLPFHLFLSGTFNFPLCSDAAVCY